MVLRNVRRNNIHILMEIQYLWSSIFIFYGFYWLQSLGYPYTILIMFEEMFMVPWFIIVPLVHQNPSKIHWWFMKNNVSSNPFIQSTGFPLIMFPMKMANNMAITGGLFHFQTPHFLEESPKTISQKNVEHFPRSHGSFPWDENTYDWDILEPFREWVKKMMLPSVYD